MAGAFPTFQFRQAGMETRHQSLPPNSSSAGLNRGLSLSESTHDGSVRSRYSPSICSSRDGQTAPRYRLRLVKADKPGTSRPMEANSRFAQIGPLLSEDRALLGLWMMLLST